MGGSAITAAQRVSITPITTLISRLTTRILGTITVAEFDLVYFLLSCFYVPSFNEAVSDNECDSY